MDESPRFRFVSVTFLAGFGVGAFVGVALGLMAFAVVGDSSNEPDAAAVAQPTAVIVGTAQLTPTPVRARTTSAIDVRIGPGNEFAAVGTIARGEALDILGRDAGSEWIAVRFPPGSSARGWLPVRAIENLTGLNALSVVIPTPLAQAVVTSTFSSSSGTGSNGSGTNGSGPDVTPGTPGTPGTPATPDPNQTPGVTRTATPRPSGPPDLAVTRTTRLPDGRVQIVITNRGSGDLVGHQILAIVADPTTRSETLRGPGTGLKAGQSITLESDSFLVTEPTSVIATVDPSFSYPDGDRSNNTLTTALAPPTTPVPTPTFGGE